MPGNNVGRDRQEYSSGRYGGSKVCFCSLVSYPDENAARSLNEMAYKTLAYVKDNGCNSVCCLRDQLAVGFNSGICQMMAGLIAIH